MAASKARSVGVDFIVPKVTEFTQISLISVQLIEKQLNYSEVASLIFLLNDDNSLFHCILDGDTQPPDLLSKWFSVNLNRTKKLLEAFFTIKNFKSLKMLGFNKYDAALCFRHSKSEIHPVKKILFQICDSLDRNDTENFINEMGSNQKPTNYPLLEYYFMRWILDKTISISQPVNLNRLIECISTAGNGNIMPFVDKLKHFHIPLEEKAFCKTNTETDSYPIIDPNNVGLSIIINQENFSDPNYTRTGSHLDVESVTQIMKYFKFEVVEIKSFTTADLGIQIASLLKTKLKSYHSMLFVFIMSHGSIGSVLDYNLQPVAIQKIKAIIHNTKCLSERPTVLIVQACQGRRIFSPEVEMETDDANGIILSGEMQNIVVCISTAPGFLSFRIPEKGTIYIQTLCAIMKENEYDHICDILTRVHNELAKPESYNGNTQFAMLPEFNSRLVKNIYLKKRI